MIFISFAAREKRKPRGEFQPSSRSVTAVAKLALLKKMPPALREGGHR
jgi:hypothetical protein